MCSHSHESASALRVIERRAITGRAGPVQSLELVVGPLTSADHAFPWVLIAPDPEYNDFHWYRLDRDDRWSHKPGRTPATNLDNSRRAPDSSPQTD